MVSRVAIPKLPSVGRITSVQNSYIQHCLKLRTKKQYRESSKRVVLVGQEVIQEVLESDEALRPHVLFVREGKEVLYHERAENVYQVTGSVLSKLSGLKSAAALDAVAEMEMPQRTQKWISSRVLALDGVQDPGNFGSLLRSCACFGWGTVIILPNCVDLFNEKVIQAARGATFKVPCCPTTFAELPQLLQHRNLTPIGTSPHASDIDSDLEELRNEEGICLCLGSEGRGLSPELKTICQRFVRIPQSSMMESLNVAVAGGILMYLLQTPRE